MQTNEGRIMASAEEEVQMLFCDGCMEEITSSEWFRDYGKNLCKFVCFSKVLNSERQQKMYQISFFYSLHNLSHMEIAHRGLSDGWTIEGGGSVSSRAMLRCGKDFVGWGSRSMDKAVQRVRPVNQEIVKWLARSIEEFCSSGVVVQFTDTRGKVWDTNNKPSLGKCNLNFICSFDMKKRLHTVTVFSRTNDFSHLAAAEGVICRHRKSKIIGGGVIFYNNAYQAVWAAASLLPKYHREKPVYDWLADNLLEKIFSFFND